MEETKALDDGLISVNITGHPSFNLDIYTAKLAIEEFEERHKVRTTPDWKMTADASLDLQESFRKAGAPFMSGALAMELWSQVNATWEEVKKNWNFMQTTQPTTEAPPENSTDWKQSA